MRSKVARLLATPAHLASRAIPAAVTSDLPVASMTASDTHAVPNGTANGTNGVTARLLRTSANPLDTDDSTIRPPKETVLSAVHQRGTPIDPERFLSMKGQSMRESGITALICEFAGMSDVVAMHGGLPPSNTFPIESITLRLADGSSVDISDPKLIGAAQQYNTASSGYEPLRKWAEAHMKQLHSMPSPHNVIVTTGSNHAVDLMMQLLLDRGDPLLVEQFAYSHLLEGVSEPHGYEPVPVPMDDHGITPEGLQKVMEERTAAGRKLPRVLFTVPVGQNPTGLIMPLERKKEIYALCCKYDLMLVEDDPYYMLQFRQGKVPGTHDLGTSFLSLDTEGRVMRFESAAKFIAPGFRVGWAALPPALARKLEMALFASTLGATPFSQVLLSQLLSSWGQEGLERQVRKTQEEYWLRASTLHAAAKQELEGLAEWKEPVAGMFLWLRLLRPPADEASLIAKLRQHKVVVVPGRISCAEGRNPDVSCPYLRLAWSYCEIDDLREGMRRLAAALRDCQ